MGTERDTVKLKLDIDKGHDPGGAYPYPWRPETGNLMYCMPKVGTRVSLYFPGFDEKDAFVVNYIRTNEAAPFCRKIKVYKHTIYEKKEEIGYALLLESNRVSSYRQ